MSLKQGVLWEIMDNYSYKWFFQGSDAHDPYCSKHLLLKCIIYLSKESVLSLPASSHIIYQTYCKACPRPSGCAVSPKQMASAGDWQGVEERRAYCNCQARSLESHSFPLHWSQTLTPALLFSALSNFTCKTDWEIGARCETGEITFFKA